MTLLRTPNFLLRAIVLVILLFLGNIFILGSVQGQREREGRFLASAEPDPISLILNEKKDFTLSQNNPTLVLRIDSLPDQFDTCELRFFSAAGYLGGKLSLIEHSPTTEYRLLFNTSYYACEAAKCIMGLVFEKIGTVSTPLDITLELSSDISLLTFSVALILPNRSYFTLNSENPTFREGFLPLNDYCEFTCRAVIFENSSNSAAFRFQFINSSGEIEKEWGPIIVQPGDRILHNYTSPPLPINLDLRNEFIAIYDLTNASGVLQGYYDHILILEIEWGRFFSQCPLFQISGFRIEDAVSFLMLFSLVCLLFRKKRIRNEV